MALTEAEQVQQALGSARNILLTIPKDFTVDAVASALGLYLILKKQGKAVDVVCDGFILPESLHFLSESKVIQPQLTNVQKFVISVDDGDRIQDFSYSIENNKLNIYITPKEGSFESSQVKTHGSDYRYDVIVTLDAPDLGSLGDVYLKHTDFFDTTSIINIDHKPENEHYGQINIININDAATAGVLYRLINTIDIAVLDEQVATCLLTGLIAKTKSFKTPNVSPQTLKLASALLEAGANKDAIIKSLYRSRNIPTINLWGRVLSKLKSKNGNMIVWSVLSDNDFVETQSTEADLPDVIDELLALVPGVEAAVLIYQLGGKNRVAVHAAKPHNALYLSNKFKPTGTKEFARFTVESGTLLDTETSVIEHITSRLGQTQ